MLAYLQIKLYLCDLFNYIMHFLSFLDYLFEQLPHRRHMREKESLRAVLLQKRRILTPEQVATASANVVAQIASLPTFQKAHRVLFYYPVHNEIDLRSLYTIAPNKEYFLPSVHHKSIKIKRYTGEDNIHRGKLGIPEPKVESYNGPIDIILIPGVAFDKKGHRLGRGGGYYDRFLKIRSSLRIGVGYKFQLVKHVPNNWLDKRMDIVIVSQ